MPPEGGNYCCGAVKKHGVALIKNERSATRFQLRVERRTIVELGQRVQRGALARLVQLGLQLVNLLAQELHLRLLQLPALLHHVGHDLDDGFGGAVFADAARQATGKRVHGLAQIRDAGSDVLAPVRALRRKIAACAPEIALRRATFDA